MKFIFLLLLFLTSIFAETYIINENLKESSLVNYTKYLVTSINDKLNVNDIIENNNLSDLKNLDIKFNPNNSVWTKIELENKTSEKKIVYLLNSLVLTEKITAYIFKDNQLISEYSLGFSIDNLENSFYDRYPTIKLEMEPNTTYKVVTQIINTTGRIDPKWKIISEESFYKFIIKDYLIWGLILGIMLIIFLLHILFSFTMKISGYKNYLIYAFLIWMYLFVNNGFVMQIFGRGFYNSYLAHFTGYISYIFYILFLNEYLNLSKNNSLIMKSLYVYIFYLGFSSLLIAFTNSIYSFDNYHYILSFIAIIILLFLTIKESLFVHSISKFYILGQLSLLFTYIFANLINFYKIDNLYSQYLMGSFLLIEIILFALGIFLNIYREAKLKNQTEKLMLSQSHFMSIGQTLRNIAHQWKIPSVRLGTLITELESIFYVTNFSHKRVDGILNEMRSNTNFMKDTITDFSNFYANNKKITQFKPIDSINNIRLLLIEKMNRVNFIINWDEILVNISIKGDEKSFEHIGMIIIDNSIDVGLSRNIKNPYIKISAKKSQNNIVIIFEDNCGGIKLNPVNSIFELNVTEHSDFNRGLGLAIAKMLVESKLGGKISACNTEIGAKFEITL